MNSLYTHAYKGLLIQIPRTTDNGLRTQSKIVQQFYGQSPRPHHDPHAGFTLLEVLVSLALIATVMLSVFSLQAQNLSLQDEARFLTIAKFLAQKRMAEVQGGEALSEGGDAGDFGDDFPAFRYRQEIRRVSSPGNLYRIEIQVSTQDESADRTFSLEGYRFKQN